ncbi:hypothetical protein KFE25_010265 [Diacronema lutheri]|uniref:Fibronectin type-III domain-containing protein n=2 Tax=Diacronema lutheri TaxID=2081491 RepID=A0A8J5XN31_DIALT|nr:hypothetical protein KFE25_010265 [Diacronema lutheri]
MGIARRHGVALALVAAAGGAWAAQVCTPYAQNTGPSLIALAWDGLDPTSLPTAAQCAGTGAVGFRVSYAAPGEAAVTLDVAGASSLAVLVTGLDSSTVYSVSVAGLDAGGGVIGGSQSSVVAIATDAAILGEVRSFGFVSAQQAVMQQLTFFDNGFPFVLEGTADAGGAQRLTLTAGADGAAMDVAHFTRDGNAQFASSVTTPTLVVGDDVLNVDGASGMLTVGRAGVLRVDTAGGLVRFGPLAAIVTSTGDLFATGATLSALRVGGAFAVEGTTGVATAAALDVGIIRLRGAPADLVISRAGAALAIGAAGSSTALSVTFDAAFSARYSDAPAFNVPANTLAVGAVEPSNAIDALTLRRVRRITSDSQLLLSGDVGGGLGIIIVPNESRILALRTLQFDPTSAQMLSLGSITLQATSATDGQILVGDKGGVFFVSTELQTVSVGDHILADAASGELSAMHMFATSTVQARSRLAVSHADEALESSTSLQHELLTVSAGTLLEPGELRLQAGAVLDGPALTLCANGARCALPSIASSASALDVFVNQSDSPVARFEGGRITVRGELHADGALVTPELRAAGSALNVTAGSTGDAASALAFNVGGSEGIVTLTPAELVVGTRARFGARVDVDQLLAVAGRVDVLGRVDVDGGIGMRHDAVFTGNNIVSDQYHPLKLESNYYTGVKIKVLGNEILMVTSSGVFVNGSLEVRDGIVSPSVTALASNLTLGTDASSVDFQVANVTVGRVSAGGIEVDIGHNFSAPEGSAVLFGDMPMYAHASGNWRNSTPVLMIDGAVSGGGSLTVTGDLQVDDGMFVRGGVWVGGDLVLSSPATDANPPAPANASEACEKGTLRWDSSFIYVCIHNDNWKRVSLAPF